MIVTFFSFKGGVGRSFSLVETAVQLAARGRSVAVWDLDLEAPGLQKIPDLQVVDKDFKIGTLDLLYEIATTDFHFKDKSLPEALIPFPLPPGLAAAGGKLSFLLPGKLDNQYPGRFASIDWTGLFNPKANAGLAFFSKVAQDILQHLGYEILLIDSRTGFTDLGALCTLQLPDLVVLVTNLNEQNLAGTHRIHAAVTQTPSRISGRQLPIVVAVNMVPQNPADVRDAKLEALRRNGIPYHCVIPLHPELLLTDQIPSLHGLDFAADFAPLADRIEAYLRDLEDQTERAERSELSRARGKGDPEELEALRRKGIYEKAKTFEDKVAELFSLAGYRATVDYKRDDMQFDVRLELSVGAIPIHALVECKDTDRPVTQQQVREFASKVEYAAGVDRLPYQPILVARSGFANNAHEVAKNLRVHLQTYEQLLRSLVDLRPNLDAAVRAFQGTALERLYVEQDVVFDRDIKPGETVVPKGLTGEVLRWLEKPGTFLTLLGDFGCGKTSFSRRLACELALKAKAEMDDGGGTTRVPVLIDLREGGSTTVTLESLLTQHFQRLSSQPFNPQALLHLNREGYLLLIFDGFDETIAYTEPGRYLENLRQILRAAEGKAKVLLTCRTHYFRDRPEALRRLGQAPVMVSSQGATRLYEEIQERPGSEIGYVMEFRPEQIDEYLQRAVPPPADWKRFREQIRQTYNLENLAERPFLLEIIVKTLPRLTERKGEVTLADLYETYCETWFNHADFRLTLTRDRKVALVEYLARLVWDSPENRVHYDVLFEKATEFFQDRPLTLHDKERIDYEVRTALFLHRDPEGYYSFIHRSFLEFFIARSLRTGLVFGDPECLALKRLTREVAFFLEFWPESKRIPDLARKILEAERRPGISENALLLLYFHARATLGPLVGPESEQVDLQEIRKAFADFRPKRIRLSGADLQGAVLPGIDLGGAVLERANLRRADLRQASLAAAWLAGASLAFADFRGGRAEQADFTDAALDHLDAQDAEISEALLRNADLSFARFTRADLAKSEMAGVKTVGAGFLGASLPRGVLLVESAGRPKENPFDLRLQTGHSHVITCVVWSPDGRCLVTGSYDGTIKIWDAESERMLNSLDGHVNWVNSVAWSPDGRHLASGSADNTVQVWEAESGRMLNSLGGHGDWINSVAWSPDGRHLASGSDDSTVRVWEARSGRMLNSLDGHDRKVNSVAWSPDGRRLASGSADKTVRVWEAESGRMLNSLEDHNNSVDSVAWSPDGRRLASGSADKTVRVWEAESGRMLNSLECHDRRVNSVAWSPDGRRLASGSSNVVQVWEAESGRMLNSLEGHEHWVDSVAWSPDGRRLASSSSDTVRVWEAESGRMLNSLEDHNNSVSSVAWSPDGQCLASSSDDKTVRLWEAESGRMLNSLEGHNDNVNSVAWSPDGRRLASGSDDQTVRLWEADSGRMINSLHGHKDVIRVIAWSPDGRRLASGSDDQTVRLWEADSGRMINFLGGHNNLVFSIAWSPDGRRLASGSEDQTVRLWEVDSGRMINSLGGHNNLIFSIAWSPDGRRLASGSSDETVRLWEAKTGRELAVLKTSARITSLSWNAEGTRLVISFESGFNEIWDLEAQPPRPLLRLYHTPGGSGFAMTPDGYVAGPPEALEYVRFGSGWALYDLTDVPERLDPARVAAALARRERRGTASKKFR